MQSKKPLGESQLLQHISASPTEKPEELLQTIASTNDFAVLSWATTSFSCCLARATEFNDNPSTDAVSIITRRFAVIESEVQQENPKFMREAVSSLLCVLLELVRDPQRPENALLVRGWLLQKDSFEIGLLTAFSRAMKDSHVGDSRGGSAAFLHACHLLAHLAENDEELIVTLHHAGLLDLLAGRLLEAVSPAKTLETEWAPFVTAAVHLFQILISSKAPEWRLDKHMETHTDALIKTLQRSLLNERGNLVVQPLHLSTMKALCCIASLSPEMARRMICQNGLDCGAEVLKIVGADEEAILITLNYLAELSEASKHSWGRLAAFNVAEMVERVLTKYTKGHAAAALQRDGLRVLRACREPS